MREGGEAALISADAIIRENMFIVMPALDAGIHVFLSPAQDVDGRA
jgi:hypothetical protein